MKMLKINLLKKLLIKEKNPIAEKVLLENIGTWFESKLNENFEKNYEELYRIREKIEKELDNFALNIEKLKNEKLRNPNIPERVYSIVQGNRESYIQKAELFHNRIIKPEKFNYELAINYAENIKSAVDDFGEETAKPFFVLKEFFNDNLEGISKNIRNIKNYANSMKTLLLKDENANIEKIRSIIKRVDTFMTYKKEAEREIKEFEEKINSLKAELDLIDQKIKNLQESDAYRQHLRNIEKKEKLEEQFKEEKQKIYEFFSHLQKILKKYEKISLKPELVSQFVENPIEAYLTNSKEQISELINKILDAIKENKLELEEEKKKKTLEYINEHKEIILESHKKFLEDKIDLDIVNKVIKDAIIISAIKEQEYKKEHILQQISIYQEEIEKTRAKLKKFDYEKTINELTQEIKCLFNFPVEIYYTPPEDI